MRLYSAQKSHLKRHMKAIHDLKKDLALQHDKAAKNLDKVMDYPGEDKENQVDEAMDDEPTADIVKSEVTSILSHTTSRLVKTEVASVLSNYTSRGKSLKISDVMGGIML